MILEKHPELADLSAEEKLELIRELYSALEERGELEPNPAIVADLHRRREDYLRDPSRVVAWEDVKRKLAASAWRK
ncbi:MAG TPA: addiction module protein [Chthoniobacteraceae bacterium]|jgi:putative addiction module component (TIGR02574 family)|nr:addiction module protein [Chthoniobacteraceae bacterium]